MADLRLYPNLPGVIQNISVETQVPTFDDSLPKQLIFATHDADQFADGTPILFNEPYFIVSSNMLASMFGTGSKLGLYASIVGETSGWEIIPVVVRIGKKSVKVAGQEGDTYPEPETLSDAQNDGSVTAGKFKVSWTGEPTWRANFKLKVSQNSDGTVNILINDKVIEELRNVTLPFTSKTLGLTIEATDTLGENDVSSFVFQYAEQPASNDELYDALVEATQFVTGLPVDIVYCPEVKYADTFSEGKNAVALLGQFAQTQSTQFKSVLAYVGTVEPANYTYSALKAWVDKLANASTLTSEDRAAFGRYVVVVAGHGTIPNVTDTVTDLALYVGTKLLKDKVYTGPINLQLPGVTLFENITLDQANTLSGKGITQLYNKPGYTKVATILVGRTMAPANSQYSKISSILVINEYVNGLRQIADKFLGQPNSGTVRMSMQSTMQNYTNNFVSTGKIAGGVVTVEPDVTGGSINAINVKATIRAFAEIEVITLNVKFEYHVG